MSKDQYSQLWAKEASQLNDQGMYTALAARTPRQRVLEVGCGPGLSTLSLAREREVLSIDNNEFLIAMAGQRLNEQNLHAQVIYGDLFNLTQDVKTQIEAFEPEGIAGWFIGADPDQMSARTPSDMPFMERPKQYRENIEDLLLSQEICLPSVQWIHLAKRGGVVEGASEQEVIEATTDDYNTYVFSMHGFQVENVNVIDWKRDGSDFMYVLTGTSDQMAKGMREQVVSILARRTSSH